MIKSIVTIPEHRCLSAASMKAMKKDELIEYIRCLEYNWSVALEFNEQQAKNFADMFNKLSLFPPKGEINAHKR